MSKTTISIIVICTFIALRYSKYFFAYLVFGLETWEEMQFEIRVSIVNYTQIFLASLVTFLLFKKSPIEILGLKDKFLSGLGIGLLCTLPMFIGLGIKSNFSADISLNSIHTNMMLAGFYEEFFFRGFAFGILFYYCGWGFISAVLVPALFFGLGHLYQAESFSDGIGVFAFTALASAGFCWFYYAWRSLWMVIFLHGFMDLVWEMFSTQSNVLGSLYVNIFRFSTLFLAIYFSVKQAKSENRYSLNGKLWVNREATQIHSNSSEN